MLMVLGWTKLPRKENKGYSDHTESTESNHSLRVEKNPPSELCSAFYDVNEMLLSCRSEQCGDMDMDAAAGSMT